MKHRLALVGVLSLAQVLFPFVHANTAIATTALPGDTGHSVNRGRLVLLEPSGNDFVWKLRNVRPDGSPSQSEQLFVIEMTSTSPLLIEMDFIHTDGSVRRLVSSSRRMNGLAVGSTGNADVLEFVVITLTLDDKSTTLASVQPETLADGSPGASPPECVVQDSLACCRPDAAAAAQAALLEIAGYATCEIVGKLAALGFATCVIAAVLGLPVEAVEGMLRRPQCGQEGGGSAPTRPVNPGQPRPIDPSRPITEEPDITGCFLFCVSLYVLLVDGCYLDFEQDPSPERLQACLANANSALIRCITGCG